MFPDPDWWPDDDLVAVGGDLVPEVLIAAYRRGLFPMQIGTPPAPLGWWSPVARGVLPVSGMRVSRSLARSARRFEIRVDTAFSEVVAGCADPRRPQGWITPEFEAVYADLHRLGWAHSVEAWLDGELAGGLYGIAMGGLFAGESMFHWVTDASKVALWGLVDLLDDGQPRLLDVQWRTEHLASLGVVEMPRVDYLRRLAQVLHTPLPHVLVDGSRSGPGGKAVR